MCTTTNKSVVCHAIAKERNRFLKRQEAGGRPSKIKEEMLNPKMSSCG